MVLGGKTSQDCPVNAGSPQGSILGSTLFLIYTNDLPDDAICDIAIYFDDTTLWQQLELVTEVNQIYETLLTGAGSGLLISMLEKLNLFCLVVLRTLVLLTGKWMSLFLRKTHILRCWGCLSLLNWIGSPTLSLLLKLLPRNLES